MNIFLPRRRENIIKDSRYLAVPFISGKTVKIEIANNNNKIISTTLKQTSYLSIHFCHWKMSTQQQMNVVFNSLPFWVFSGCVLFFLFFCFAVGVSGDLFLLFLDCLKPTPQ